MSKRPAVVIRKRPAVVIRKRPAVVIPKRPAVLIPKRSTVLILRCERSEPRRTHPRLEAFGSLGHNRVAESSTMQFEMYVYMLRCRYGSYHVGSTKQDIDARVWEHNNLPIDGYTARRRPVTLVFAEAYDRITDAIARERQIKGWSRRKKEALVALAYESLPELSRRSHLVPPREQ
jgi:putative endonuclease